MNAFSALVPRLLADLFLAFGVFFFPWWATVALGALLAVFFRNFYELFIAALAIDLLYGGTEARAYGLPFFVSFISITLYVLATRMKSHLLIYR